MIFAFNTGARRWFPVQGQTPFFDAYAWQTDTAFPIDENRALGNISKT
jgi:hypothetical protein